PNDSSEEDGSDQEANDEEGRHLHCDHQDCSYRTNRTSNLHRHRVGKHTPLAKPQICCDQVFKDRFSLDRHRGLVHRVAAGEMPCYKCPVCGAVFSRRGLLARHMSVHNGVRPFACQWCTYRSSHKYNLMRHQASKRCIVKQPPGQVPNNHGADGSDKDSGIGTCDSGATRTSSDGSADGAA
ncbi:unnamed protein product, partial [Ixodes hexagonus]